MTNTTLTTWDRHQSLASLIKPVINYDPEPVPSTSIPTTDLPKTHFHVILLFPPQPCNWIFQEKCIPTKIISIFSDEVNEYIFFKKDVAL
jgi:hypothetical protein